jgi:hypothetical protein
MPSPWRANFLVWKEKAMKIKSQKRKKMFIPKIKKSRIPKLVKGIDATSDTLFNTYLEEGFKAIKCKGYHPKYNPNKDYKIAKIPCIKGFTKENYISPTMQEVNEWVERGGWIGWLIPKGFIALDVEDKENIGYLESICHEKGIKPAIHLTKNGKHYLFKLDKKLSASSEVNTKAGIEVTYRIGGENYLILAPIDKRRWENLTPLKKLPELPIDFHPCDRKNIDDLLHVLSWQVGCQRRNGALNGWEDMDTSFMSLLIECGLTLDQIQESFELMFLDEYDEKGTEYMYQNNLDRRQSGEPIRGTGSFIGKIREHGLTAIETLVKSLQKRTGTIPSQTARYFLNADGHLWKYKSTKHGDVPFKIANFNAWISEEIIEDNGLEKTHHYVIEGTMRDKKLSEITVQSQQFPSLNWLHKWGVQAIVEPGVGTKDYVRHYIQTNSKNVQKTINYAHTGWREIDGEWVYLSAGGAIGADNVKIQLTGELAKYNLPTKAENEQEAIRASLSFLDVAKREITLPLLTLVYLSPLTTLLSTEPNFSVFIHGPTGAFKSTLAVLALSHFGDFEDIIKLSNLEDTSNALEKRAFTLKDALMVLDDYHPSSSHHEGLKMESTLQRTIRAFSNRTGRARLNQDTSEKGRYEPRGMLLVTGEELISIQSTLARCLVIEMEKQDVDVEKLTELQAKSDVLTHAMCSYIIWVQSRFDNIKDEFSDRFKTYRDESYKSRLHPKLHDQFAFLQSTLDIMLDWLIDKKLFTEEEARILFNEGWRIFSSVIQKHAARIEQEDPVSRFIEILYTLLKQGKICLAGKVDTDKVIGGTSGELIGYFDDSYLYLLPSAAWNVIQRYCNSENTRFPIGKKGILYKMLRKAKLIETKNGNNTLVVKIRGVNTKCLWVYRNAFDKYFGSIQYSSLDSNPKFLK